MNINGNINDKKTMTAPCGMECFNCELYEDNLTDDFAEFIHTKMGVPKEDIACQGCRKQDGKHFHLPPDGCITLNCVKEQGLEFCFDCRAFPCTTLAKYSYFAVIPYDIKSIEVTLK